MADATPDLLSERDLSFLLYEVLDGATLFTLPAFAAHDRATFTLLLDSARRLQVGGTVEITVPGKPEPYRGQIEHINFKLRGGQPGEAPRLADVGRQGVTVIIRPDRPFDFDDLGFAVRVTFL